MNCTVIITKDNSVVSTIDFIIFANTTGNSYFDISNLDKGTYSVDFIISSSSNIYVNNKVASFILKESIFYVKMGENGDGLSNMTPTNWTYAINNAITGTTYS